MKEILRNTSMRHRPIEIKPKTARGLHTVLDGELSHLALIPHLLISI